MDFLKKKFYYVILALILAFGVLLRLKVYFLNTPIWQDEAAIAVNIINRGFFELFLPLDYIQCAPSGFLILSKFFTKIFGENEYGFRFLPLLSGILSVFGFYFLSKNVLKNRWVVLIANYLFCFNFRLIYFSQEFKQYSLEVLITIVSILILSKIKIFDREFQDRNSLPQKAFSYIVSGFIFFVMFLFMMPAPVIFGAFVIYLFYRGGKNIKETLFKVFFVSLPFVLCLIPYYLFYLLPSKKIMVESWSSLWDLGYINFNIYSFYYFSRSFFKFLLNINSGFVYVLFALILFVAGGLLLFKERGKTNAFILAVMLSSFSMMIFRLYPVFDRLSLYLLPLVLLIMLKPLDKSLFSGFKIEKPYYKRIFIVFITIFLTAAVFRGNCVKNFKKISDEKMYLRTDAKLGIDVVKNDAKITDKIILIGAEPVFYYYTGDMKFKNPPLVFNLREYEYGPYSKILNEIDSLKKQDTCWILAYGHSLNSSYHEYVKFAYIFIKRHFEKRKDIDVLIDTGVFKGNNFVLKIKVK